MKIYNEDKTKQLNEKDIDLDKGCLKNDKIVTHVEEVKAVNEKGHYEIITEYENGGKEARWVVDEEGTEYVPAHDIEELVQIYVPYTEEELKQIQIIRINEKIDKVKKDLANTDYKVMKYIEGLIDEEEFNDVKEYRAELRAQINELEQEIWKISKPK